ncbi:recombinase family protein [Bacillus sp. ISL-37]|uniref:recombinase family protein n=1 Tax=Bacillus sp. ISL-37 TaxID=2819123 RepID=UPI001BE627E3|nr:recombinase family protein [Bacillus sp. ISL-37]MBT2683371.1 recombinase family protein [Bacillus sp. ISL-37]
MNYKIESALYIRSANNSRSSLESQRLKGEKYAKLNSISLSIIEDAPSSGFTPFNERSGLRRLVHLIEVGLINIVIVDSLIRISRDVNQILSFVSLIDKHNAKLIVLDEAEVYRN